MSRNNDDPGRLSIRDKELVALGAAIASNCIPCIQYHVPQARKAGLSDSEISEAVALADKVRQVPAAKVLQTASALLKGQNRTPNEDKGQPCGCPDEARNSTGAAATGAAEPRADEVGLDSHGPEEDNETKKECCGENSMDSNDAGGSDEAAPPPRNAADHTGSDFSKLMKMMQKCCPERIKSFSSILFDFENGPCTPNEDTNSTEPG